MHTLEQLNSGALKGTKQLKLSCGLTQFPEEIFSLSETLELLDLSGNRLSSLPHNFGTLSKLKIAFFSDNYFTELPKVLADCKQLDMIGFKSNQIELVAENSLPLTIRWLILTNNRIKQLPKSMGNYLRLQKVALAGNQLIDLTIEMANCKNLELLRISANLLTTLPVWLLKLPKLSWLAFAGNPFCKTPHITFEPNLVDWNDFEILKLLGEGASGHIYKAKTTRFELDKQVAIKVFKGDVTSDGFPEDEMRTFVAAGSHRHIVGLLGKITNHPEKKQALVMKLIPEGFFNLGLPPSFITCSRDTFNEGTAFSALQILSVAKSVASAIAHLHNKGITHGDLYAHNTLIDKENKTLIGDFGAASFFEKNSEYAKYLQQIESRAFGCLLEDLLNYCTKDNVPVYKQLLDLKTQCLQYQTLKRPYFEEIRQRLEEISLT